MISEGRVVNVKHDSEYDVYIGHQMPFRLCKLKKSIWANPYAKAMHKGEITREEALAKYREHVLSKPELVERLPELRGRILGCWCAPDACHGDVLVKLADQAGRS